MYGVENRFKMQLLLGLKGSPLVGARILNFVPPDVRGEPLHEHEGPRELQPKRAAATHALEPGERGVPAEAAVSSSFKCYWTGYRSARFSLMSEAIYPMKTALFKIPEKLRR